MNYRSVGQTAKKWLRRLCIAVLFSVLLLAFIGAVAKHGWPFVVFILVVGGALVGAVTL